MKYYLLFFLILQQLCAQAQIDTIQSKIGLESFLKRQYRYTSIELHEVNTVIKDSTATRSAQHQYWLKADFNHDGITDLFVSATVQKGKRINKEEIFIVASNGKRFTKVDIDGTDVNFMQRKDASYSIFSNFNRHYLVIKSLESKTVKLKGKIGGYKQTFEILQDTLFVQDFKPMIFTSHPESRFVKTVSFSATQCFGTCPVFQLTIKNNGTVRYKGVQFVDKVGDFNLIMSKADLKYLESLLAAIKPLSLSENYHVDYTDAPTVYLTVEYSNGQNKAITDYGLSGTYGLSILYNFLLSLRHF